MTVELAASSVYRFGAFELDAACRELRRDGAPVDLPSKPFSCVVYLIENRHRVVDRDELMRAVWGHVHLTESVLGQAIRHARQVLGDSGEDQQVIKTVRGFGYRWTAHVDAASEAPRKEIATVAEEPRMRWRRLLALLALTSLAAVFIPASTEHDAALPVDAAATTQSATEPIALLLPVAGTADPGDAWIRLGLMDFIANRLRAAGQPMVPTDTVIMLLHGAKAKAGPNELLALTGATHARLVLQAEAERQGQRWHVTLRSLGDARPSLAAAGDGDDVLAAARRAADGLAIVLGRIPAAEPDDAFALTSLVQRIHAAVLAQKPDLAQQLIRDAPPELRAMPEIRYEVGRNAFYNRDRETARTTFEALLKEVPAERDPLLRARTLNGLGAVFEVSDDLESAERTYEEGARLLEPRQTPDTMDTLGTLWMNLGNIAQERRDFELARERMARARRVFESTGNVGSRAELELDVGVLEARGENYADALRRFESAAALHAAIHSVSGELTSLCYVIDTELLLLNPRAAAAAEPRIRELLALAAQPWFLLRAKLTLANLFYATGRNLDARALMDEVLAATASNADLAMLRRDALMTQAEQAVLQDDAPVAARIAGDVVQQLAADSGGIEAVSRGNAWRILIHADIALRNLDGAQKSAESMRAWSRTDPTPSTRIYTALAEAELAVALGQHEAAGAAYERALALADASHIPQRMLLVVESYVRWLLDERSSGMREDRILRAMERTAEYADGDYGAALVRLRVYHALGPLPAWQSALEHARSIAGERSIPPELQTAP